MARLPSGDPRPAPARDARNERERRDAAQADAAAVEERLRGANGSDAETGRSSARAAVETRQAT